VKAIIINENSEYDACRVINEHLQEYKKNGWKLGDATCLAEGRYNIYKVSKGDQEIELKFDMQNMLGRLSIKFSLWSMSLTSPIGFDGIKELAIQQGDADALASRSFYAKFLAPIVERVLALAVLFGLFWLLAQCGE